MIYVPNVKEILDDEIATRKHVEINIQHTISDLLKSNFFPAFVEIKTILRGIRSVLNKKDNSKLVYDTTKIIEHAIMVANVVDLYSQEGIYSIRTYRDMEKIFSFTKWLLGQYESLCELERYQEINQVWYNLRFYVRGTRISVDTGIMVITYQDELHKTKTEFFSYDRKPVEFADDKKFDFRTEIVPNITISGGSNTTRLTKTPRGTSGTSMVVFRSDIPASFLDLTLPVASQLLALNLKVIHNSIKLNN